MPDEILMKNTKRQFHNDAHPLVLKTDQTHCYNESGDPIPCRGSGQDAEVHPGQEEPEARFEIRKDIAADLYTGLIWSRDASPAEFPMTWAEAFEYISGLNRFSHLGR